MVCTCSGSLYVNDASSTKFTFIELAWGLVYSAFREVIISQWLDNGFAFDADFFAETDVL